MLGAFSEKGRSLMLQFLYPLYYAIFAAIASASLAFCAANLLLTSTQLFAPSLVPLCASATYRLSAKRKSSLDPLVAEKPCCVA